MSQPIPKRPTRRANAVITMAAEKLAPSLAEWMQEPVSSEIVVALAKALRWATDGYQLAKDLEQSLSIDPDADLVERLADAWYIIDTAKDEAVAAWVEANDVRLTAEIGTVVMTPHGRGEIKARDEKLATYTVRIPAHEARSPGYLGTHIDAEDCSPVSETEAA